MTHAVARLLEPLLRLLFPARGRHRAAGASLGPRFIHGVEVSA
ncbi:hypothetical protein [Streptomyces vastus]